MVYALDHRVVFESRGDLEAVRDMDRHASVKGADSSLKQVTGVWVDRASEVHFSWEYLSDEIGSPENRAGDHI